MLRYWTGRHVTRRLEVKSSRHGAAGRGKAKCRSWQEERMDGIMVCNPAEFRALSSAIASMNELLHGSFVSDSPVSTKALLHLVNAFYQFFSAQKYHFPFEV